MRVWMTTAASPGYGISRARIPGTLTRETWRQKAALRRGVTSVFYTYLNFGRDPETGPWHVTIHGNDVNFDWPAAPNPRVAANRCAESVAPLGGVRTRSNAARR